MCIAASAADCVEGIDINVACNVVPDRNIIISGIYIQYYILVAPVPYGVVETREPIRLDFCRRILSASLAYKIIGYLTFRDYPYIPGNIFLGTQHLDRRHTDDKYQKEA